VRAMIMAEGGATEKDLDSVQVNHLPGK
jgi:hypothetical protein